MARQRSHLPSRRTGQEFDVRLVRDDRDEIASILEPPIYGIIDVCERLPVFQSVQRGTIASFVRDERRTVR
jgi:hypothetical protein